jgi:predicted RNA-binding Zn ribbon-like protein
MLLTGQSHSDAEERDVDSGPAVQPGGRLAAPGRLGLLQAFLNSHYDLARGDGAELLSTPAQLRAWMSERGLLPRRAPVTASDLERALAMRAGLRQLIAEREPGHSRSSAVDPSLHRAIRGASLELRLEAGRPELVPVGVAPLDRALGALLSIAAVAMIDQSWVRLKVCPGRRCGWVFYDHSRNNSGRWCSMSICGAREKSRSHYRRHRGHDQASGR